MIKYINTFLLGAFVVAVADSYDVGDMQGMWIALVGAAVATLNLVLSNLMLKKAEGE